MIRHRELVLTWDPADDRAGLRDREWIITNGLGGYASGSVSGMPTRKYHGLFVPNLSSPKGRYIMISRCDEEIVCEDRRILLGGAEFENDRSLGEAHRYLREFRLDHRTAIWVYDFDGTVLEKAVVLPHNQNTVCVRYRLLAGDELQLRVRPFMSFRRHDDTPSRQPNGPFTLSVCRGRHEVRLADSPLVLRMALRPAPAVFVSEESDGIDQLYRIERDRGDPALESIYCPGYFDGHVTRDQAVTFVATTQAWAGLDFDVFETFDAERRRMTQLLARASHLQGDDFAEQLAMAADQFIVLPGSRLEEKVLAEAEGTELRTVIAGYHWFGDWGRDTMISLEGLTLCTARYREASAILRTFSHYVRDGLLPNLFPEGERQALYHTVDATLWYFHALDRYVTVTGDTHLITQLYPVLLSIIEHHLRGTHYNIHVDPIDGLVSAAAEGYQLTWMDAKMGDWVVTPRRGKPVEIQALWYNALRLMALWTRSLPGVPQEGIDFSAHAQRARESFNDRYYNATTDCLFDVIDGPDGSDDPSIRPNQVFAISLRHPILEERHWAAVLGVVRSKLLTPFGLRTLSPEHPDYKRSYRGDLRTRDGAYHQGTVWPWLIGHFTEATLKLDPDRARAREMLSAFRDHLYEAGVGSISEVFDANEPYGPAGCIAQAWSVAEVLRAWLATRE
jgi:predicted glycogen debranching enzyme